MDLSFTFRSYFFPLIFSACGVAAISTRTTTSQPSGIISQTATIDQFGHLYYATSQNRIIKLNEHGDSLGYYENNSFGEISLIDVTNPLKVLIYYQDFYSGVVLDRLLNETQIFNMLDLGYGEIRAIASSIDGAMWIFNDHEQRLMKATQNGQVLLRGEDLRLRFNERLIPNKIAQSGESLFIQVPDRGILVFDLFGQYETQILFPDIQDFQLAGQQLLIRLERELVWYDPRSKANLRSLSIDLQANEKVLYDGDALIRISANAVTRERMDFSQDGR